MTGTPDAPQPNAKKKHGATPQKSRKSTGNTSAGKKLATKGKPSAELDVNPKVVLGTVALLLAGGFAWNGLGVITGLDAMIHPYPTTGLTALALTALVLAGIVSSRNKKLLSALATLTVLLAILAIAYPLVFGHYARAKAYSHIAAKDATTVSSYQDRAPWLVANNLAARDQGDNVGSLGRVAYVPDAEQKGTSRYATIITGRSAVGMQGYQSIREFNLPAVGPLGSGMSSSCLVPSEMGLRLGSFWPHRSLDRAIHNKSPFSHYDEADAYGYCDGSKPVVVVPLTRWSGLLVPTKVPAGAAVYSPDGLRILSGEELAKEKIEGPTMPASLSRDRREGLRGTGTYADWWSKRSGYDATDKDEDDANAGNTGEFTLVTVDGAMRHVTPLTPRGSSQTIVATLTGPAQQDGTEQDHEMTIETKAKQQATSTLENTIRSASVDSDPEWATRWSAGMRVYEIVPAKDGHWAASIGMGQTVNYRADISPEGAVTVSRTDRPKTTDTPESTTVQTNKPLSEMTEAELVQVIKQATDELAKRAG
ncbi:hypothetical protein ACTQ49_05835 [Luteococcus sp. Sow4_B9]|uniref:hypothetical protein n=1 Tax=Luteococcus sp. Sow4_B9 TaxID=3438792 RepID=UPI003F9E2899